MSVKQVIAVIPARGGSKGILNKNITPVLGIPMIGRVITTLKNSLIFDDVVVSSDSETILEIAEKYGANCFKRRSKELSDDITMPDKPVLEYLEHLEKKENLPMYTFMIQCTSPFIEPSTYISAFNELKKLKNGTVFSAEQVSAFIWRRYNDHPTWNPVNHPFDVRIGRQFKDYIDVDESGGFYGFHTKGFLKKRHRFFEEVQPITLSRLESIDIDTIDDLLYGEYLYSKMKNEK
jgi:CMP-N-acetylneuraminic acid synthetase